MDLSRQVPISSPSRLSRHLNSTLKVSTLPSKSCPLTSSVPNYRHFPPEKTLIVDMVTVHPFYQRRGHGRKLISWGLELAKLDNLGVGTVASNMGNLLFVALGFKELERPKIGEEEEENEKWIEVCVVGYPGEV